MPTGFALTARGETYAKAVPDLPKDLVLSKLLDGSQALLSTAPDAFTYGPTGMILPGCQHTGLLGNCLVGVTSVFYDLRDVVFTATSLTATGVSSTLLPGGTVIPAPGAFWLLGSGLGGLAGLAQRRHRAR